MNIPDFSRLLFYMKKCIALYCCRAEQILVDVFLDTPAETTPVFIIELQNRYMDWRIRNLKKKMYPRYEPFWTVFYPRESERREKE